MSQRAKELGPVPIGRWEAVQSLFEEAELARDEGVVRHKLSGLKLMKLAVSEGVGKF